MIKGMRYTGLTLAALIAIIWFVPLVWTVLTAFRPESESVAVGLVPGRFTLETLVSAWQAAPFGTYYWNTIVIAGGTVAVQLVTSVLAAYAFARLRFPGRELLFYLYLAQMMIPAAALVIPNYLTMKDLGLLDTRLAIMIPYFGSAMGTFLLRQTFRSVPQEYEDAARVDGAKLWRILWHVYLPMTRPTVLAFALVSFSFHWDDFFWPLIVTNTDPARPLTVGLALFTQATEAGADWQLVAAATFLVILPILILFVAFQRMFVRGYMHSGLR